MRAVVFDLDGTLIDSDLDILASLNRVLRAGGQAELSHAEIRGTIGDGAKILVERAFAARGAVGGPAELAAFLEDYNAHPVVRTAPYPGIVPALEALRAAGHKMGVCTNKPEGPARDILRQLGLQGYFSAVTGGDSTPFRKPDSRHLAAALGALGVPRAVMIGDHENDVLCAAGLGVPSIFVSWGYGAAQGDYIAHKAEDLPGLIARMG